MSESNSSSSSGGIGFVGLLTIVFVTLKLLGKIDWPWVWVLSPVWIATSIVILFLCGFVLLAFIAARADKRKKRRA